MNHWFVCMVMVGGWLWVFAPDFVDELYSLKDAGKLPSVRRLKGRLRANLSR